MDSPCNSVLSTQINNSNHNCSFFIRLGKDERPKKIIPNPTSKIDSSKVPDSLNTIAEEVSLKILVIAYFRKFLKYNHISIEFNIKLTRIILIFFIPLIINNSMRFSSRVTSFRNIRFNWHGTYGKSLWFFVIAPIVSILD